MRLRNDGTYTLHTANCNDYLDRFASIVHYTLLLDVFTCRLCRCSTLATANLPLPVPLGGCMQSWSGAGESRDGFTVNICCMYTAPGAVIGCRICHLIHSLFHILSLYYLTKYGPNDLLLLRKAALLRRQMQKSSPSHTLSKTLGQQ